MKMEYRNELKFGISDFDLNRIKYRLLPFMHPDSHQGTEGYQIRSLYFDDLYDSCMFEKESGITYREKFRLRVYNNNPDYIRLEKKTKSTGLTKKAVQKLTCSDYNAILANDMDYLHTVLFQNTETLLKEFVLKILHKNLSPKCIVSYDRFAFIERTGNVRITFDQNISGSRQIEKFFQPHIFSIPVMPPAHQILEVKYDELLPHYILQALDLGCLRRQSFSKYYITRAAIG